MDESIAAVVESAVGHVQEAMKDDHTPSVVVFGDGWVDMHEDYWWDPSAYERLVGHMAVKRGARIVALAVPLVMVEKDATIFFSEPQPVLYEGMTEMIYAVGFSADTGFELARSLVHRDATGKPSFEDIEILRGHARMLEDSPGYTLMQWVLATA